METNKKSYGWTLGDLSKVPKNDVKVMSTFSCGGGSSMGYKLAGCSVIAANDIDPEMAYHYKLNLNPENYFLCPIKDLFKMDLPKSLFELDILDGSPPCSTFSMAGKREKAWSKNKHFREGQAKQVLSDLFFDYLDLVDKLKPKVAIAENVKGMLMGNAKGYTKEIVKRFKNIGYTPQVFLVNAADCGVPQKRERVFFCAYRSDLKLKPLKLNPKKKWVNVEDALGDIELTQKERTISKQPSVKLWWPLTRPGEGFDSALVRMGLPASNYSSRKVHPKKPAMTLTATDCVYHYNEQRLLCFKESKRLGSFPDDYWAKSEKIGKYMIGMSVPPKMTEAVARAVCSQWLGVRYES